MNLSPLTLRDHLESRWPAWPTDMHARIFTNGLCQMMRHSIAVRPSCVRTHVLGSPEHLCVDRVLNLNPHTYPPPACVGEVQQCFAIHCVDRPGCTDLRASTRDSHLRFLKVRVFAWRVCGSCFVQPPGAHCLPPTSVVQESGRVVKGGPLLAQPSAGEIASAGAVGHFPDIAPSAHGLAFP